jgi:hypothetical protein
MDSNRPGVTDFVHIGLVVEDLDETIGNRPKERHTRRVVRR